MSLKTLLGLDVQTVRVGGKRLTLRPLTVRQAFVVEECFRPIAGGIVEHGADSIEAYADHGDRLIKLVAEVCGKPEKWVGDLRPEEFNELLAKALDVNRDFFNSLVLQVASTKAQKLSPAPGPRSSRS